MRSLVPIETNRTTLRALTDGDLEEVHAVLGDPATSGGRSFFQPNQESTAAWIGRRIVDQRTHGFSMWAVQDTVTNGLVGLAGLFPSPGHEVEIGYVIRADRQREGLATEVVAAIVDAADCERLALFATIRAGNEASIRLARRSGFRPSGTGRGEYGELLMFRRPLVTGTPAQSTRDTDG